MIVASPIALSNWAGEAGGADGCEDNSGSSASETGGRGR